jgi:FtsP/CotA-like multicopper oxidase with cupredoxin domain
MVSLQLFTGVATLVMAVWADGRRDSSSCSTTKVFDWTLTWEDHAPDGFSRKMLLINGRSPGPLLAVNEGDRVIVNLHNDSPRNTSLHFHGSSSLNLNMTSRSISASRKMTDSSKCRD